MSQLIDRTGFPAPTKLFNSREEAHACMMQDVDAVLQASKELGCFPDEKLFVESVKELWLDVWSRYAPRP